MHRLPHLLLGGLVLGAAATATPTLGSADDRPRVVILADMGNEPDEEQQMVHLLVCANAFDLEGLIAVTGKFLRKDPQPDLFFRLIEGYDKVRPILLLHADGWPETGYLQGIVRGGQRNYGIADTGAGKSSPGSRLLETIIMRDDPRPVYVVVNAGSNTLAQALLDLEAKGDAATFARALAQLRVFENGAQDDAGAWICHRWPGIHWIRSNYQTYCYGGPGIDGGKDNRGRAVELGPHTWQPYAYSGVGQHQWALEHLKGGHGPLLALWPVRQFAGGGISFLEGGGTIPWLGLVNPGLSDLEHPEWGGWSGRFNRRKSTNVWSKHADVRAGEQQSDPFAVIDEAADTWTDPASDTVHENSVFAPVWRWRQAFFNDFAARADWCVKPFAGANHHPVAAVNGDASHAIIRMNAKPGETLAFDAGASSDPDNDNLTFRWWIYPEAGSYAGAATLPLAPPTAANTRFSVPIDAGGTQLHLILEVTDQPATVPLTDYRRVVIDVSKS